MTNGLLCSGDDIDFTLQAAGLGRRTLGLMSWESTNVDIDIDGTQVRGGG